MQRQRRNNRNNAKKKNPNKRNARTGAQRRLVGELTVKTVVQRELGISSSYIAPYKYSELPTLRFNTAVQLGSIFYRMNDMLEVFDGTFNTRQFPFYIHLAKNYLKSWVLTSSIEVIVQNREAVNSLTIIVFPSIDNTAVTTSPNFIEYASLPGAKKVTLQASTGGMSTHRFLLYSNLKKMFGDQYLMQDQYANLGTAATGGISAAVTVPSYWGIAYYNATGANTITTGGITCEVTIRNSVQFFEPNRSTTDNTLSLELTKAHLSSQITDLTTKLSLLK